MKTTRSMTTKTVSGMRMGIVLNSGSRIFCLVFFIVAFFSASSQTLISALPDSVIEQRLVELAIQGPDVQKIEHQNKITEYQLKAARNSWMNFLTLSANYNDQTLKAQSTVVYPKYFFGLNIPIGTIISSKQAKIAKESVTITALDKESAQRKIKADVLSAWKKYKAEAEILSIETGYLNDLQVALSQANEKFQKNGITFEQYNTALKNRNDQQAKLITLKMQHEVTKLGIEQLIGTSLESVIK